MTRLYRTPDLTRRQFLAGGSAALGLAALAACSGGGTSATGTSSPTAKPQSGGTMRFGYYGGSSTDTLDVHYALTDFSNAAGVQLWSSLMTASAVTNGNTTTDDSPLALAESIEVESPTSLVVRLKDGLTFHKGQPITANDVLASFARFLDPNNPGAASPSLVEIDVAASTVLDPRTVRFGMSAPNAFIANGFANALAGIYPGGQFDPSNGSGPFKTTNFRPGTAAEFVRFDDYQVRPLLEGLVIQNLVDDTAKLNALRSGAIDLAGKISPTLAPTLGSGFNVYRSDTGGFGAFVMDAKSDIFKDPRVRQAFRLIADRPALVKQVLGDAGKVANDVFSPFDPAYIGDDLPQRKQDIDKAKSLLKAAGAENLTFDMATGVIPNLEVAFAQQAKAAGVTINVKQVDSTTFFSQHYGQDPFYTSLWPNTDLSTQLSLAIAPGAYYPEGNWDNPKFLELWEAAKQDQDQNSRNDKLGEIQQLFYDEGTYIIYAFNENIDASTTKVAGVKEDNSSYPVSFFNFTEVGFA